MRVAYADPPYIGMAHHYGVPEIDHEKLIEYMCYDFPDGWALSCTSTTLKQILPHTPKDIRVAAWVKPFCSFKPGVNPAYTWEPVIFRGGRTKRERTEKTIADHLRHNIAIGKGLFGAKPDMFCWWICDLLGLEAEDEMVDLFVGTGTMTRAAHWYKQGKQLELLLLTSVKGSE